MPHTAPANIFSLVRYKFGLDKNRISISELITISSKPFKISVVHDES